MVSVPQGTEQVDIGPFTQGLVETINPWDIGDRSLQECVNLDIMDDGMLVARRGLKRAIDANNWLDAQGPIGGNQPIECDTWGDYDISLERVVFASSVGASNGAKWLWTKDPSAGWTELATTGSPIGNGELYRSSVIYNGVVYVVPTTYSGIGFTASGKSFLKSQLSNVGGSNSFALSAVTLPRGEESFVIKDRMFVVSYDESKIYWSKATDPTNWTAPDGGFLLVNPGDNGTIQGCVLFRDILYVFKDTGIWRFSFTNDPAIDGYLYKITDEFGGAPTTDDVNIYFVNDRGCYVLVNDTPQNISNELDWRTPILTPTQQSTKFFGIFTVPGQVIIRYGAGKEGFSYNTHTGTWSRYLFGVTSGSPNQVFLGGDNPRFCRNVNGVTHYLSSTFFSARIYYCRGDWKSPNDYLDDKIVRVPRYRFKTKYYTFGERLSWKRFKKAWLDGWFDTPSSAGGDNLVFAIDTNTAFSNELRTTVVEPIAAGPLINRWFKLGNRRFLSMAFIMDTSTGLSYVPATGTKDTLTDDYEYWFIRRIIMHVAGKQMESV